MRCRNSVNFIYTLKICEKTDKAALNGMKRWCMTLFHYYGWVRCEFWWKKNVERLKTTTKWWGNKTLLLVRIFLGFGDVLCDKHAIWCVDCEIRRLALCLFWEWREVVGQDKLLSIIWKCSFCSFIRYPICWGGANESRVQLCFVLGVSHVDFEVVTGSGGKNFHTAAVVFSA